MRRRLQIAEDMVEKIIRIRVTCITIFVATVISKSAFAWPSVLRLAVVEYNNLIDAKDGAGPSNLSGQ